MRIDFVRFRDAAICPAKFDSVEDVLLPPSTIKLLRTDIVFKIPRGYLGKIHRHYSFALRSTDDGGGVIDAKYRGSVSVIFFSFSARLVEIEKGIRFAQIIFKRLPLPNSEKLKNLQTKLKEIADLLDLPASSINMSDKILVNKYIPKVVPKDLP